MKYTITYFPENLRKCDSREEPERTICRMKVRILTVENELRRIEKLKKKRKKIEWSEFGTFLVDEADHTIRDAERLMKIGRKFISL
jgi:hypothetical protein